MQTYDASKINHEFVDTAHELKFKLASANNNPLSAAWTIRHLIIGFTRMISILD